MAADDLVPRSGFRNKIINGCFRVWTRGTTNANTDALGYLADRWKVTSLGTTISQGLQTFALGTGPNESPYYWQGVVSAVAANGNFAALTQPIENVRTFSGRNVFVSFYASASANLNLSVEMLQTFGTGGSPSPIVTGIGSTKVALTTTRTKFTIPITIPSVAGKVLGSNNDDNLRLNFWFSAGSDLDSRTVALGHQSGAFNIDSVQIVADADLAGFEQRHESVERDLCAYYAQVMATGVCTFGSGLYTSTTNFRAVIPLAKPLRARGTPALYVRGAIGNFGTTSLVASAMAFANMSPGSAVFSLDMTVAGATAGNASLASCTNSASSLLLMNELP